MVHERSWRSTWKRQWRVLGDALGYHHGERIRFSPPLPCSFARGSRQGGGGGGIGAYRGVYPHDFIIWNRHTLSFQALSPTHSCRAVIHPRNVCSSLRPDAPSYPLGLHPYTPRARTALSHEFPSDAIWASPHHDHRTLWKYLEAMIEQVWWYTWRPWLNELRAVIGGCDWASLGCTWRPWLSELRDAIGGHD